MEHNSQSAQKINRKKMVLNSIKFIGFIILALIPMQLIVVLMSYQNHFSVVINGILGVVYLAVTVGIIILLRRKYIKYSYNEMQKMKLRDIGFAVLYFFIMRIIAVVGTLLINKVYGEDMSANDGAIQSLQA